MNVKELFNLNPEIIHLNHGSFGACPRPIFETYQNFQTQLERDPVSFIKEEGPALLEKSKSSLATYLHANAQDIIYVPNPTTAMNTVIKNLELNQGDEILSTNQEYGAIENTWEYYCNQKNAKFVKAEIPMPFNSKEEFLEVFWNSYSEKTRYVFLSHCTSTTATIFPIKEICKKAHELGLITIIDGAHIPGHIDFNLKTLGADIYTGALHKWLLAPKGSSFLFVTSKLQKQMDPLIVSWGYDPKKKSASYFQDYHQFNGTRDFSAYLCTPACLKFFDDNDWEDKKKECRDILREAIPEFSDILNSGLTCPANEQFLGQMLSFPIKHDNSDELQSLLRNKYKISIPIMTSPLGTFLRISYQAYNKKEDLSALNQALREIFQEKRHAF